jgi:serine-type D-Ala-D-Ala endopeptidase (penicillin-binding protein 7)
MWVVVIFAALAAVTGAQESSAQPGAPNAAPPSTHHGAAALRPAGPRLELKSNAAVVIDESLGLTLYAKNSELIVPIASITKLMTAMVVIDAQLPFEQEISIDVADTRGVRYAPSRLKVGSRLTRGDSLWLALMASENRGAAAAARTYPGGTRECVADMNRKAVALGMLHTRFADATGLSPDNVSTARDLSKLVRAAYRYPQIRRFTTSPAHVVMLNGQPLEFHNSNSLVKNPAWIIGLSKTGYINEAGRCLVMRAQIAARPVTIVLLDSWGEYTRLGDANRIRKWMEAVLPTPSPAL